MNSDLFFPERGDFHGVALAKRVCAGCVVRDECLAFAVDNREEVGVWGGTSPKERRSIRRARRSA
jgi:WhiB family redox-sensing transcriptional regulator